MKRGFLFGLGSFLALGVLNGLDEVLRGKDAWFGCTLTLDDECQGVAGGMIAIALSASLSVVATWKATGAAANKSRLHAIGGWLIGFCVIPVFPLAFILLIFAAGAIARWMGSL
jgi:hypothetical protein